MDIAILPFSGLPGVGRKRQFILTMKKTGKVIMMDDDLRFYKLTEDGMKFPPTSRADTEKMIADICEYLDGYSMVGLTDKFMSQTKPRLYVECQRFNQVLGFNRDLLPDPWPQFRLLNDEEHDVHLQLLTKGYRTAVSTEWSKSDIPNATGGCSDWRNDEVLKEAHDQLLEWWPTIVTIKPNPNRARYNWKEAKRMGGLQS
jgi:hypothetical protein